MSLRRKKAPQRVTAVATGLLALMAVLVGGCKVGPNYVPPKTQMPAGWSGAGDAATQPSAAVPKPADLTRWWTAFNDPELDSLVVRAVAANLDLKLAESRIRQARATRGVVAADLWPTVTANGSATRRRSPSPAGGGNTSNLFQAGFDAAWELDLFGGTRRNIESAQADIEAAIEDRRDVLVTLLSEVALNYIQLRGFQNELAIARENLQSQKDSLELTKKRIMAGLAAGLDQANAEAQVATTASQIPTLEASIRQTIYTLSALLTLEPGALTHELTAPAPIPPTPPEVPVGLPSDLLRRRPDIRRAERQLAGATARIGVATADLFPKFSFTGAFGLESDKFHSLWNFSNNFWSFGPSMSWPIFEAGKIRSNIAVQNALTDQALTTYEKTVLGALQDVENALVAYGKEQEHRKSLQDAVAANLRAVDLSERLYRQGLTDFLNVLLAQRALNAAQDALSQSNRAVSTNLVALYKALGGGWETLDNAPGSVPATQPATTPETAPTIPPATAPAATQPMGDR